MLINEVIKQVQQLRPRALRRQARVNQLVAQKIAVADQKPPTVQDVVLAQFAYGDLERQTNKSYIKRLQQQLAAAKAELAH